jgi:hypothetical protein
MDNQDTELPVFLNKKKNSFFGCIGELFGKFNFKLMFLLFIVGIIIFSDLFAEILIAPCVSDDSYDGYFASSTKCTYIQLLILCLSALILEFLISEKYI